MKKISLFLTGLIISFTVSAQVEVTMTNKNLKPDFYEAHLPFLSINFASTNSNFYADFGGSIKKGSLYADLDFRIAYVNGLEEFIYGIDQPTANSIYDYKSPKAFIVHGGYMFSQKEVDAKVDFHLKSGYKTIYYTEVDDKKTEFWMANVGYKSGFDWVTCKGKDLTFEGAVPAGFIAPGPEQVRTMMDYSILEIGISRGSIGFWEADIKDYGHRTSQMFKRFYFNLLFLMSSEIDPVYAGQTTHDQDQVFVKYDLNNSPRTNLGFCLGAETKVIKGFGIGGSAEIGYYPGIKGSFGSCLGISVKSTLSLARLMK